MVTYILELIGASLIVTGVWLGVGLPAGLVVAGGMLIYAAYKLGVA